MKRNKRVKRKEKKKKKKGKEEKERRKKRKEKKRFLGCLVRRSHHILILCRLFNAEVSLF